MDGDNITLDKDSFKALAVDTRISILKILHSRPHTLSEMSEELELSNPTVKEHLEILERAELVARHDEGRKWKYYKLTRKGVTVVNPKEVRVFFSFVFTAVASVGFTAALIWRLLSKPGTGAAVANAPMAAPLAKNAGIMAAEAKTAPAHQVFTAINILSVLLLVAVAATIVLFVWYIRTSRKKYYASANVKDKSKSSDNSKFSDKNESRVKNKNKAKINNDAETKIKTKNASEKKDSGKPKSKKSPGSWAGKKKKPGQKSNKKETDKKGLVDSSEDDKQPKE